VQNCVNYYVNNKLLFNLATADADDKSISVNSVLEHISNVVSAVEDATGECTHKTGHHKSSADKGMHLKSTVCVIAEIHVMLKR